MLSMSTSMSMSQTVTRSSTDQQLNLSSSSITTSTSTKDSKDEKIQLLVAPDSKATTLATTQARGKLFKLYELLLANLEIDLKSFKGGDFKLLHNLLVQSLKLLEADIYPESKYLTPHPSKIKKISLVQEVCNWIHEYFKNHNDTEEVATLIFLFHEKELKYYYDYNWLYEERHKLFAATFSFLQDCINKLVKSKAKFSPQSIAQICSSLTHWQINVNTARSWPIFNELLDKAEFLYLQKQIFSPEQAFLILDSLYRADFHGTQNSTTTRADFLKYLIKTSLPLLLENDKPLKLFDSKTLTSGRIRTVKSLLPPILDFNKYGHVFFAIQEAILDIKGICTEIEVYENMPEEYLNNKDLCLILEKKEHELWGKGCTISRIEETVDSSSEEEPEEEIAEDPYRNRYHLMSLAKYIGIIYEEKNPRGLAWLIKKFSDNMLPDLCRNEEYEQKGLSAITWKFHPQDVKEFLKIIRKYAFDIVIPDIAITIAKLCQQAITTFNLKVIDNDLAIELLWINLVFSVLSNDTKIAFTQEQQELLFNLITTVKNDEHAHELFAIKSLCWHGSKVFPEKLSAQLLQMATGFTKSSNPSQIEIQCYTTILNSLDVEQKNNLHHDYICEKTGMEIDIAYISKKTDLRVAINIDGSPHYHAAFKTPTLKTLFRNECLQRAGWQLCNVDVTLAKKAKKEIKTIISILLNDAQVNKDGKIAATSVTGTTVSAQASSSITTNNEPHQLTAQTATFFSSAISSALSSSSSSSLAAFSASVAETEVKQTIFATSASVSSGVQVNCGTSTTSVTVTVNPDDISKIKTTTTTSKEKTVLCKFFPLGTCKKGENCTYAHGESELVVLHH